MVKNKFKREDISKFLNSWDKEISNLIKRPSAWRAVGRASGSNPIPIVIPCHRVIKSSGDLGGYSGGGGTLFKSYLQLLEKK